MKNWGVFMTDYQLECFVQVAELLSFVKAAEKMCISQPAITYQIRSLEKEMNVILFERNTRNCKLTLAGQAFYYDAVQLLAFSSHAIKKAQDIHNTHKAHFRIGIRKLFDYDRLAIFVEEFQQEYTNAEVDVLSQNDANPLEDLRTGKIDAGIFYKNEHRDVHDICFEPLYTMDYYVLMKKNNPLANRAYFNVAELKSLPIITAGTSSRFLASIQEPIIPELIKAGVDLTRNSSSFEGAMVMVRSGSGMLVLPMLKTTELQGMVKIPLLGCEPLQVEVGWRPQQQDKLPKFVEIIKKIYGTL